MLILIVVSLGVLFTGEEENQQVVINQREEKVRDYDDLREVITGFVGTPYELGPLDEGDNIYREDAFDCTTLVLVSVSNLHSDNPEEKIKDVNYHPEGEVSYENRLHFSTYRNKINNYFSDITTEVGGEYVRRKDVVLNRDRLIDIDWQKEITIDEIRSENVPGIVDNLPEIAGVMFMRDSNPDIGLDINHEGFVLDGEDLVHASPTHGQVHKEDFLSYLENSTYDSVAFFKIN